MKRLVRRDKREYTHAVYNWTTHDEKIFIDGLGGHTENAQPRVVLLAKYIKFMLYDRVNFGNIDKDLCVEHAQKAIAIESER